MQNKAYVNLHTNMDHSDQNIDLNARAINGMTAFMKACSKGHKDVVQLLLDHSNEIELNARISNGMSPFMLACAEGHKDVVQLFLDHPDSNIERLIQEIANVIMF